MYIHVYTYVYAQGSELLPQKAQQYAQKRVRVHNATPHVPNTVSYSGVGIALCESAVFREYRCEILLPGRQGGAHSCQLADVFDPVRQR